MFKVIDMIVIQVMQFPALSPPYMYYNDSQDIAQCLEIISSKTWPTPHSLKASAVLSFKFQIIEH